MGVEENYEVDWQDNKNWRNSMNIIKNGYNAPELSCAIEKAIIKDFNDGFMNPIMLSMSCAKSVVESACSGIFHSDVDLKNKIIEFENNCMEIQDNNPNYLMISVIFDIVKKNILLDDCKYLNYSDVINRIAREVIKEYIFTKIENAIPFACRNQRKAYAMVESELLLIIGGINLDNLVAAIIDGTEKKLRASAIPSLSPEKAAELSVL